MQYRVLGPLEVLDASGQKVSLGGAMQQSVLASLLLRVGKTVPLERLVDELWEEPPATAARTLQAYVSRLRHALPKGAIESRPGGYAFVLDGDELDLDTFERLADHGHVALAGGDYQQAAGLLRDALALWRGPALAGLTSAALRREAARLEELRLSVLEDRVEADLGCARHGELVPELKALVAEHPLRERLRAQLMRALYRSGRSGEALALYREGRRLLVEELGMEPGQELRELEQAILRQDAELEAPELKEAAVAELPSGTVTFLFTDIEGSTALLKQVGRDRYQEALAQHGRILQSAFAAHGGRVVDTQGDSFFVAFRTGADAVAAAVAAQRDLAAHSWSEAEEMKVRMGLHTGEPKVGAERYVGIGVHRAARIGSAGHGGQVLLSSTTKELAEEELPVGVSIRDLGTRRLKDIDQPQRLYQLVIEGLESNFGPLSTLDVELRRKRRRMYAGSALIGVVAAAVAIPIFALGQGGSSGGMTVTGSAVAIIDPASNRVTGQVPVGARPEAIAFGEGGVWVSNLDDETVSHVDPETRSVHAIKIPDAVSGLAAGLDAVWAVSDVPAESFDVLSRINPRFDRVTKTIRVRADPVLADPATVAVGRDAVWVGTDWGLLKRVDPSGSVIATVDPGTSPTAIAEGAGAVWVGDPRAKNVARVDSATNLASISPIPVGNGPRAVAVGADAIWVALRDDDAVVRIDPDTNAVTATIGVGRSPTDVEVGYGAVWVVNSRDGTVSRIDPKTNGVMTIPVGGSPQRIAVGGGRVWVTVQPVVLPSATARTGGAVRINSQSPIGSLDPALSGAWSIQYATCANLLNYPDRPAPAGSRLEPEVAAGLPTRSADGKTYTFTIRPGFRFSPPSNEPVTARTFQSTIKRALSPKTASAAKGFAADIVGAKAYQAGKTRHIAGVTVRRNRLMIRLTKPAPDFLTRISLPLFCPVPLDTPVDLKRGGFVSSAGPYYIASYTPGQGAVLKRNPNYRGSRPHHLDKIEYSVGVSKEQTLAEIDNGEADFAADGVPSQERERLAKRYGPGSPAAKAGRQRLFVNPQLVTEWLALNTSRSLFSDARVRRAVNYAVDRRTLARIGGFAGERGTPTDQLLPPGLPGFRDARIYPFAPDLAKARMLAHGRGGHGVLYTCTTPGCRQTAQVVQSNLEPLGIDLEVKYFPIGVLFQRIDRRGAPFDAAFVGWFPDYPDPSAFLNQLLYGPSIGPKDNNNWSYFDDPLYNRRLEAAARLSGPQRYSAYAALDADLAGDAAPFAALLNGQELDLFSARMGCQVYHPVYGVDLAALCIRGKG
jgi:YVTN family beta-propeller protein